MSFDIYFLACRFAKLQVNEIDPVTGASGMVLPNEPLTTDELAAVRQLLERQRDDGSRDPDH